MSIHNRSQVAEDTSEVTFKINDPDFFFVPGQYVRINIPYLDSHVEKGSTRDFTISSNPLEKGFLSIVFRNSNSPFKKRLLEAPLGETMNVRGPLGVFTLPEDQKIPIVFIATGVGITPVLSMLRYIYAAKTQTQMQVVWGNSKPERVMYIDEIRKIINECPNLKLFEVIGKIDFDFLRKEILSAKNTIWYICGQPEMVLSFADSLPRELDISQNNLRIEEYPGYASDLKQQYIIPPPQENEGREETIEQIVENKFISKALLTATSQGALIAMTDAHGTIEFMNDKFLEISQYSKKEVIGQNHRILKSGYHSPALYRELWSTISSGRLWKGEIKNRAKDGTYYWVDTSITPIFNERNEIIKYVSVRFLITEQKDLESSKKAILNILKDFGDEKAKLALLSNRLELAIKSANIGIWEWSIEPNLWVASEEFYNHLDASAEDFKSPMDGWAKFISPDEKDITIKKFQDAIASNSNILITFCTKVQGGSEKTFKLVANCEQGSDSGGSRFIGVILDVTVETVIDRMKSDFISLASHQLRTPLTAIKWYCELLSKESTGEVNLQQADIIKGLMSSTDRMVALVTGLLNISRIESGRLKINPTPTDLKGLIESIINESKQKIEEKKLNVELNIPMDIPHINIDPKLVIEIYQNILENAIKYTPESGNVRVELSQNETDIISKISDTGCGIPDNAKERIFQRFFRAENILKIETDGTGLGLYLAKSIVEISGGKIQFESEEGKGSTFTFTLPKCGSQAVQGTVELG